MDASVDYNILKEILTPVQVLEPGSDAYSKAVFIGNLNYRMTMPAVVVQAHSVQDVQSTIKFAQQYQVRLTVKNGGHSYMGYCLNEGGIVLDMSLMNNCSIDTENMTICLEGGVIWKDAYYKLLDTDPQNIFIGGQCPTVGVSGFTLGGGLSPFSRSYGLACDNLIEMTVVTADAEILTISGNDPDKDKRDLFWALSGGGGGNFGVTVSMVCKVHKLRDPQGTVVCGTLGWNLPQEKDAFDDMMDVFNSTTCPPELTVDALWTHGQNKQLTGGMTVIYNGGWDESQAALSYLLAFNPSANNLKAMHWNDWVHQAEGWDPFSQVYHHHSSFIFAEKAVTRELNSKISDMLAEAVKLLGITDDNGPNDPKCHILWDHIGAETTKVHPDDTAFFWRDGHYVSTIKVQWADPDQGQKMMEFLLKCKTELLPYAIQNKAAYLNYIDGTVPNWQEAYYGDNYPRLQQVKTRWDPRNFFYSMQSVEPLENGTQPREIHGELEVPSLEELEGLPEVKQVQRWWDKYASLETPDMLGSPKTEEDVFHRDAEIRKAILRGERGTA